MYDNPVCKGAGVCVIVGGTVVSGFWLLGAFLLLVLGVVAGARVLYKRKVAGAVADATAAGTDGNDVDNE